MTKSKSGNLVFINLFLWVTIFFSTQALVYYIRWFVPFLNGKATYVVPVDKMPFLWFVVKICDNIIFLLVGFMLIRLFGKYRKTGFFDKGSLRVFDGVIICCLVLAFLGFVQTVFDNFYVVHFDQWTSFWGFVY